MRINWRLVLREGLLTGLIFCVGVMAMLRINPLMFIKDFPEIVQKEFLSMKLPELSSYETILGLMLVQGPLLWGSFRLLSKLKHKNITGKRCKKLLTSYLHLIIWVFIVMNIDLVILDWLVVGVLKAPILGFEQALSPEAVKSYQSCYFHFTKHYLFYETYFMNIFAPLVLLLVYKMYVKLKKWC